MKIRYPNILKLGIAIILGYAFGCCLAAFAQAPGPAQPTQPPPTQPSYPAGGGQPKAVAHGDMPSGVKAAPVTTVYNAKTPAISDSQKAKFFKAQSEFVQAQVQLQSTPQFKAAQQKQATYQAAIQDMQATCGKDATFQSDQENDPTCVAKPKPAAAPKK